MSRIFNSLGIYGWTQDQENILLASLLTGDRVLLVSPAGAGKTLLPKKISKALGASFGAFDVNAQSFDDIIGYVNIPKMKEGKFEYVDSPGSIWGKDFVCYEEINRCNKMIQGKLLEHLRSGTIQQMSTGTKWCWANMNPISYDGTNRLMGTIVDRFAWFVWPPVLQDMDISEKVQIVRSKDPVDCPAMALWMRRAGASREEVERFIDSTDYEKVGRDLNAVLLKAVKYWEVIEEDYPSLDDFIAVFSDVLYSLMNEQAKSNDNPEFTPLSLSGRGVNRLKRCILSYRAIELALNAEMGVYPNPFRVSLQNAVNASIPVGVNEDEGYVSSVRNYVNLAVRQSYHVLEGSEEGKESFGIRLLCTRDPIERAHILLHEDLDEGLINTGWQRICNMNDRSADLLAFLALQLDTKMRAEGKDPFLPNNVIENMKKKVRDRHVIPDLPRLPGQLSAYYKELNDTLTSKYSEDPLKGLVAVESVHEFVRRNPSGNFKSLKRFIDDREEEFSRVIDEALR